MRSRRLDPRSRVKVAAHTVLGSLAFFLPFQGLFLLADEIALRYPRTDQWLTWYIATLPSSPQGPWMNVNYVNLQTICFLLGGPACLALAAWVVLRMGPREGRLSWAAVWLLAGGTTCLTFLLLLLRKQLSNFLWEELTAVAYMIPVAWGLTWALDVAHRKSIVVPSSWGRK